jgi:hypothetical protein
LGPRAETRDLHAFGGELAGNLTEGNDIAPTIPTVHRARNSIPSRKNLFGLVIFIR